MSVAAVVHARAPRLGARVCSRSRATTRWHAVPLVAKRHPPRPSAAKNEIEIHPFSIDTDGSYLVTGAVGFIGSHVCELLMSKGASVVAVDNFDSGGPYPVPWKEANLKVLEEASKKYAPIGASLAFVRLDVSDVTQVRSLFTINGTVDGKVDGEDTDKTSFTSRTSPKLKIKRVCHLGARSGIAASFTDAAGAVTANVTSTAALLQVASEFGVRAFVLGSSGSVYGDALVAGGGDAPVASRETDSTNEPRSPYAASKRSAEVFAFSFWSGNKKNLNTVTVCRIFTVYGPRGRPDMAVFRFINSSLHGKTLCMFGNGDASWRDYAHVGDVARGLLAAMHRTNKKEGRDEGRGNTSVEGKCITSTGSTEDAFSGFATVNVASGEATSLRALIEIVTSACGGDPKDVTRLPGRPGDVGGTFGNVSQAERVLGWRPLVSLRDGIQSTVEWYQSDESISWREP